MRSRSIAFWALVAVTGAVYVAMVAWALPHIAGEAGGLQPFDLRPLGYSHDEAKTFLAALTPAGADFYIRVQHALDLAFPALLAATLFFAIVRLAPPRLGVWRYVIALVAIPGAVFDYLENAGVSAMLALGADGIDAATVAAASRWTVLKSAFDTLAFVVLLAFLVAWLAGRLGRRVSGA